MRCNDSAAFIASYNPMWGLPSGDEEWLLVWIATGVILLVAFVIVVVLMRRGVGAKGRANANTKPSELETGPDLTASVATAKVITLESWPELPARTLGWATRATILEPVGNAWRESGAATGLEGSPEAGFFEVPTSAGPIMGLALEFTPTDTPTRELAIVGTRAGATVVGVILHASAGAGADLEWKATRRLNAAGECVRVTFPRAVLTRNVTVILRPQGPASIAGVALVGE